MPMMEQERKIICRAGKLLFEKGFMQYNGGNISMRDPESGLVCIKPSGKPWCDMSPEDLIIVDLDGNVIEGDLKPSIETQMHTLVYKTYPAFHAVIHSHPVYVTAWSSKGREQLDAITVWPYRNEGPIKVAPFEPAGSEKLAQSAVEAMGDGVAAILQSHGLICAGKDMDDAAAVTFAIEATAKVACIAECISGESIYINEQMGW